VISCKNRDCLSREEKLRRSYYEVLRDELDQFVLEYSLVESYHNFLRIKTPYPFVELRELKPRARIPTVESDAQNSFLIIFTEDFIEKKHKKYIRYFDANKTTKNNLLRHKSFPDVENFNRDLKFFETRNFFSLLKSLLPIDYALLIQKRHNTMARYALTHFHVRIDWPIAEAAEDLAREICMKKGMNMPRIFRKNFLNITGSPSWPGEEERLPVWLPAISALFPELQRSMCLPANPGLF